MWFLSNSFFDVTDSAGSRLARNKWHSTFIGSWRVGWFTRTLSSQKWKKLFLMNFTASIGRYLRTIVTIRTTFTHKYLWLFFRSHIFFESIIFVTIFATYSNCHCYGDYNYKQYARKNCYFNIFYSCVRRWFCRRLLWSSHLFNLLL